MLNPSGSECIELIKAGRRLAARPFEAASRGARMPVKVIIFLHREQTPLNENDALSVVPSIAGGTALRCICS
jgi:molybdopterin converting factor small subunit